MVWYRLPPTPGTRSGAPGNARPRCDHAGQCRCMSCRLAPKTKKAVSRLAALFLLGLALLCWQNREQLNQPNRRGTDPYARWCDRQSPRGPTYVDFVTSQPNCSKNGSMNSLRIRVSLYSGERYASILRSNVSISSATLAGTLAIWLFPHTPSHRQI